jgi:hypothetical protein
MLEVSASYALDLIMVHIMLAASRYFIDHITLAPITFIGWKRTLILLTMESPSCLLVTSALLSMAVPQ